MRKRPEVPKHLAKVHARKLLERQERADLYEKGLADAAKYFAAGSFFPVDVAEGVSQGALTPPASYKAAMMRPPVPSDYQIDPETGTPVFKGRPPVVNPEYKGTTEHVGKQLGVDVEDPGGLAPQVFSPDPFAKIKALGILGKAGLEGLGALPLTAGVFASNRAKTLPKLSRAKAQDWEKMGTDPQEIFEQTGFFRGPEGEWRFEISDKDMKIKPEFLKTKTELWTNRNPRTIDEPNVTYAKLSDAVEHPELFKAYPELEDIYIKFEPDAFGYRGYYSDKGEMVPVSNTPERPPGGFKNADEERAFNKGISEEFPEEFRKVISVVAPTRQSEIARLDRIIVEERSKLVAAETRIDAIQKNVAEGRAAQDETYLHKFGDEYKTVNLNTVKDELTNTIERSQEKIKDTLPELQRLQEGGHPDLEFSVKSTITHEIQHAIQDIENLPPGGNTRTAWKDTQDAAVADILEKAKKKNQDEKYRMDDFGMMSQLDREKRLFDEKLQDMAMMDKVHYLQQLQKFILSDEPTRNARFIENSSFNYGLTLPEERVLGPRPKKHRRQEYAEYLRRKAMLYQKKVIDMFLPGSEGRYSREKFNRLLGDLVDYTEKKGTATHPKEVGDQFLEEITLDGFIRTGADSMFDPKNVGDVPLHRLQGTFPNLDPAPESVIYEQPNWLVLGEKNVKNYVKRLARAADKHAEGAGLKRQIETKLADLDQKRKDYNNYGYEGSDYEFYKRLAGEAEARAVQKRLELAEGYSTKLESLEPGVDQDLIDYELLKLQEAKGKVPTEIYDVPKEELAFTRRSPAAKTQAKTDARKMLAK